MIKLYDMSEKLLIILLVLIILSTNVIGGKLYGTSYFPNFIAEFGGIFTGILITLVLVNRFNRIQRRKQWEKVELLTFDALTSYLIEFYYSSFINFNNPGFQSFSINSKNINNEVIIKLKLWIKELNRNTKEIGINYKRISDNVVEWYKYSENEMFIIRNILFPRILEISDDNVLVDSLIDFDTVMMELNLKIKNYELLKMHFEQEELNEHELYINLFPDYIDALIKITAILKVIVERKESDI